MGFEHSLAVAATKKFKNNSDMEAIVEWCFSSPDISEFENTENPSFTGLFDELPQEQQQQPGTETFFM